MRCGTAWLIVVLLQCFMRPCAARAEVSCEAVARLAPRVEELRGLRFRAPVSCRVLAPRDFSSRIDSLLSAHTGAESAKNEELMLKGIGLVPPQFPYARCMFRDRGEGIWAIYDRDKRQIVLRSDLDAPPWLLGHELVHALQDQHFGLKNLQRSVKSLDQDLALSALIEGDAVRFEADFRAGAAQSDAGLEAPVSECQPPESVVNLSLFSYEWGSRYAEILGTATLDAKFKAPPATTREILYPTRVSKTARRAKAHGATPYDKTLAILHEDSLGEFALRTMLKNFMPRELAIMAAKGWAADTLTLSRRPGGEYFLDWQIDFETSQDIDQFQEALRLYASNRFGVFVQPGPKRWQIRSRGGKTLKVQSTERSVNLQIVFRE